MPIKVSLAYSEKRNKNHLYCRQHQSFILSLLERRTDLRLSVIIPCYNLEKYVDECLSSLCSDNSEDLEIICIDDGSVDRTPEILKGWQEKDPRIKMISQQNSGISIARNRGLEMVSGDCVLFLDGDDLVLSVRTIMECCERIMKEDLDLMIWSVQTIFESEAMKAEYANREKVYEITHRYEGVYSGIEIIQKMRQNQDWKIPVWTKLYRRTYLQENSLGFIPGILHEDELFTLKSVFLAKRTAVFEQRVIGHKVRQDSIMTNGVSCRNLRGYLLSFVGALHFLEEQRKLRAFDSIAAYPLITNRNSALKVYLQLDEKERRMFLEGLSEEERYYFDLFIAEGSKIYDRLDQEQKRTATLLQDIDRLKGINCATVEKLKNTQESQKQLNGRLQDSFERNKTLNSRIGDLEDKLQRLKAEIDEQSAKLRQANNEKSDLNVRLQQTFAEKSELSAKLKQTYTEKSELNAKLKQTYAEKSEINAKLKQAYADKAERGQRIKELEEELKEIESSRMYKVWKKLH